MSSVASFSPLPSSDDDDDSQNTPNPPPRRSTNQKEAKDYEFNVIKQNFFGRKDYTKTPAGLQDAINNRPRIMREYEIPKIKKPGIPPFKQVELFSKYRAFVPEEFKDTLCPKPSEEVIAAVKGEKKDRMDSRKERNKKRKMEQEKREKNEKKNKE